MTRVELCVIFDEHTPLADLAREDRAQQEATLFVGPVGPVFDMLRERGARPRSIDAYGMAAGDAGLLTTRWLRAWSNMPLGDGRTLKERLRYDGETLWWAMDVWLLESAYHPPLHAEIRHLDWCCDLLDREAPRRIVSLSRDPQFNQALALAGRTKNVSVQAAVASPDGASRGAWRRCALAAGKLARFAVRKLLYAAQDRVLRLSARSGDTRPRLLVYSGDNWQRVYDPVKRRFVAGDLHLNGVLSQLLDEFAITFAIYIRPFALMLRAPVSKARSRGRWGIAYKPFEAYLSWHGLLHAFAAYCTFRRRWASMRNEAALWSALEWRGVPAGELVRGRMGTFMRLVSLEALFCLRTGREIVAREKPRAVLLTGEPRIEARSIILAARRAGTPVVSLQHGRFADHHFALVSGDLGTADPLYDCPLPDRFALYGEAFRDFLIRRGGLEADRLVVTGAPRWDHGAHAAALYRPAATRSRLGLPEGAPIVLLTTAAGDEDRAVAEALYSALVERAGVWLVHKLHTAERHPGGYRRLAQRIGFERIIYCQLDDLIELLFLSAVLVTPMSTTLIDAAVTGTPAILFDPYRRDHDAAFGRHAALHCARNKSELSSLVQHFISPACLTPAERASMADFARLYAMSQDGLAHQRVAAVVRSVLAGANGKPYTQEAE